MIRYKIFLFRMQGFEEFQSPDFLGSDQLAFVAVDPKLENPPLLVRKSVSAAKRCDYEFQKSIIDLGLEELRRKLSSDKLAYTLLSKDSFFEGVKSDKLKAIILPKNSTPTKDFQFAERQALDLFQKVRDLETLEIPDLNFKTTKVADLTPYLGNKVGLEHIDITHKEVANVYQELHRKKKMLVHICCGPDAAGVINQLKDDYELLCFWYDPNIQPKEEYDLRLEAFETVAKKENIPYIVGEYDVDNFFEKIKGLEYTPEQGAKCTKCYDMRLERSALEAQKQNCDLFTSSLAISPHKVQQKLKTFGELHGETFNVPYYARNFMKDQGFKSSVEYSKIYNIYRQDYCGCYYSLHEGGVKAKQMAKDLGYEPN
ncbi:epoxyqueuosine reductase QueH [bacterium]|nr:epoxyqueuosine reductase QueH [bacterium]